MNEAFPQLLSEWSAYFGLMGGAAATLLGLLFVAVSLRLNIFHRREIADVRRFAALTLGTFLAPLTVSSLVLAPHGRGEVLAAVLLVIGIAGIVAIASLIRLWSALETPAEKRLRSTHMLNLVYFLMFSTPYVGAIVAAFLLWRGHPDALGWLAIVEMGYLVIGTAATWLMLSHAGRAADQA